ncbi:hypothetical protein TNCV_975562 [Trichonephila clavipes]|nr:hypothetical protein TNCV_975562 [Trichonephila clavipes]
MDPSSNSPSLEHRNVQFSDSFRFFILKTPATFTNVSPFLIEKAITGAIGEVKSIHAQFDRTSQIRCAAFSANDTATRRTSVGASLPALVAGNQATTAQIVKKKEQCLNCKGEHPAYSRSCPTWITEKEITAVKIKEKISYPEARRVVLARTPVSGKSYASATRKSTSDKCIQCDSKKDISSDSSTPTEPEVIAPSKNNSPPRTKVIAKPISKSPPPVKKKLIQRTESDSPRKPKSRRAHQRDLRPHLTRIPKKLSRDFHRKLEDDTLTGDCSEDDEDLMDIQSGPSTSSSRGGASGAAQ